MFYLSIGYDVTRFSFRVGSACFHLIHATDVTQKPIVSLVGVGHRDLFLYWVVKDCGTCCAEGKCCIQ